MKFLVSTTRLISRYFNQIDWDGLFSRLVSFGLQLIGFTILFWVLNRLGQRLLRHFFVTYEAKTHLPHTRVATMRVLAQNVFAYSIGFFYLYAILTALGVPVNALLASAGVLGLALGLGAQGFVSDVVTGFFIILESQFDVGDNVRLGEVTGQVVTIGLRTTIIQSTDGTVTYIPNRNISIVANLSRQPMQALVKLPLSPTVDQTAVRQVIDAVNAELVEQVPAVVQPPNVLGLTDEGQGRFAFAVSLMVTGGQQSAVQRQFLAAYVTALNEAGITLARPAVMDLGNSK